MLTVKSLSNILIKIIPFRLGYMLLISEDAFSHKTKYYVVADSSNMSLMTGRKMKYVKFTLSR